MDKKMYIIASSALPEDIRVDDLTHLIIANAHIGLDFKITGRNSRLFAGYKGDIPTPGYLCCIPRDFWERIPRLKQQNPNLKVIVSIGGRGADGFSDLADSAVTRKIFADSVSEYINKHNLDGIDIDWEYPTVQGRSYSKTRQEDRQNFTYLLADLKKTIGDKEISITVHTANWYIESIELIETTRYISCLHIKTHGFASTADTETRHHTNLFAAENDPNPYAESADLGVARYFDCGLPPELLCITCAGYGIEFRGISRAASNPILPGLFQKYTHKEPHVWSHGIIPYNTLQDHYINKNDFKRFWDDHAKAPFLYSETEKTFITYEDEESVAVKMEYAEHNELKGVCLWHYTDATKLWNKFKARSNN